MKNKTVKVIIFLVGLLFLNIEAAQAGLIQRFKLYIGHEFPGYGLAYLFAFALPAALLSYIILIPATFKESGRHISGYNTRQTFGSRRSEIKKIANILKDEGFADHMQG